MFQHYFQQIIRNFKRFRSTFIINWIGLSSGLACSFFIYLWVADELSVDKFNANDRRLYGAMEHRLRNGGIWTSSTTSGPLADDMREEFPEVEYSATLGSVVPNTLTFNETTIKANGRFAQKDFFTIFSYEILEGSKDHLLDAKNGVVISASLAVKLFGTATGAVSKAIIFNHNKTYFVSGVYRDILPNATDQFEFVGSWDDFKEGKPWLTTYDNTGIRTIVVLKEGVDVNLFNKKIANYIKVKTGFHTTHRTLFLKKYSDDYLYGKYENAKVAGGRIEYVKLFSVIAVFILVIACINFMNLSTAKASRRIKEVGIKKALGANRLVLIRQYLGEALLMTMISLLTAILLVAMFLPHFNQITGKFLSLTVSPSMVVVIVGVTIFTGILSGSYPALYLSGFSPGAVLKGKIASGFGEVWARKGLVVFQFVLSILFIVGVVVVYQQIKFVQSANLGYDKEHIVYFPREGKVWDGNTLVTMLAEIKNIPGVVNASGIGHNLRGHNSGTSGVVWPGKNPEDKTEFENVAVNYGMMETLGLTVKEGRAFSADHISDSSKIIFNEAGIKFMGMTDPIGKTIQLWGRDMEIVGVVKDFNFESLHNQVKPLFIRLEPNDNYLIMIKLQASNEKETIQRLQDFYARFNPGFKLDYKFLDQQFERQYVAEARVATLSRYFAGLAILISCLGLFGLAAFTAERRLKEIGIRKVLGSGIFGIVFLLSKEFTRIVGVAILIALPLSWWATKTWLDAFAFKIQLHWWYFAGAAAGSLLIAWFTVGIQALKAARAGVADCLKDE